MKKCGGSVSTIIVGPFKSVLVNALHSLENVLGLARFRALVPNIIYKTVFALFKKTFGALLLKNPLGTSRNNQLTNVFRFLLHTVLKQEIALSNVKNMMYSNVSHKRTAS